MNKAYIGDSVYARIDEVNELTLTTENGYGATNVIILEPEVWRDLIAFCRLNWPYEKARHDAEIHASQTDKEAKALRESRDAAVRILEPLTKQTIPSVLRIKDALDHLRSI